MRMTERYLDILEKNSLAIKDYKNGNILLQDGVFYYKTQYNKEEYVPIAMNIDGHWFVNAQDFSLGFSHVQKFGQRLYTEITTRYGADKVTNTGPLQPFADRGVNYTRLNDYTYPTRDSLSRTSVAREILAALVETQIENNRLSERRREMLKGYKQGLSTSIQTAKTDTSNLQSMLANLPVDIDNIDKSMHTQISSLRQTLNDVLNYVWWIENSKVTDPSEVTKGLQIVTNFFRGDN